ncbi:hypothetical protein EYZ11_013031 [Aspergillus tanneri]|uniref:Uncharacterized protein n=1 Tax=Aspergillus tanneri TaxID=1220188 RepID=A0A4S3IZ74_9EURO|nr:hypothetical protein EYZ11_013031 [Aspergillus tanneri]
MAHQADALPWKDFASIFDFAYRSKRHHGETNLFARQRTSVQVRQLYSFVSAFVRILEEHTDKEMSITTYKPSVQRRGQEDIVLDRSCGDCEFTGR